jgi:flagellar hook-basal body complex protein FliE
MINLQKAGLAMQMTTTVRGKVIEAYRDLIKMQF